MAEPGTIALGPTQLALAALLLVAPTAISFGLKLGLEKKLVWAGVRTVAQLALVGLILEWVFALDRWFYVVPVLVAMLGMAARAAINRTAREIPGSRMFAFGSLVLATTTVCFVTTETVIGVDPWYKPQYVIPLLGMLLGNGLNGISLSLDRLLEDLLGRREAIEARLSLGATVWVAVLPWMRQAVRTGMIPIINSMMIVGLVSLPGMMTGQILAGAEPRGAVAYQILIMFMICCSTALGTIMLCLLAFWRLRHPEARVRWEIIEEKN
jgi:putative ABC transport system permease protein